MTKLLPYATIQNTSGENAIAAGAAPSASGTTMQGNPDAASRAQDMGNYPPGPQVGGSGQTLSTPLAHDTISRGGCPLNTQPSNLVNAAPGSQSLLALLSSGQVTFNQTNYGNAVFAPASSPANQASPNVVPAPTGPGSAITVPAAPIYLGD